MDFQRIFILLGLAVTTYMLILAWNDDYGQGAAAPPAVVDSTIPAIPPGEASVPSMPSESTAEASETAAFVPSLAVEETASDVPAVVAPTSVIRVSTDVLRVEIDPRGGDIVSASLPGFPADIDTPEIPFVLMDPRNAYASQSGLIGDDGTDTAGTRPLFTVGSERFDLGDAEELRVSLTPADPAAYPYTKVFTFRRGDYLINVDYEIRNTLDRPLKVAFYGQIRRDGAEPVMADNNVMGLQPFVGAATRSEDELYSRLEFDDLEEEAYRGKITGGYMAMVQHYFVSAWIPPQDDTVTYSARQVGDTFLMGYNTNLLTVAPGETATLGGRFYVGPKDQYQLREYAEGLDLTVDYGFLWWLAQPLFYLLTMIHGFAGNWGVAIILLTVIVKALLYPLSAASFRSMAKMRKLQPEMQRLKERYGDDRQKFSEAMMELYKKEGANPLGGCLPILLQMPVFLALYWALMESVELRQAPFVLWIDDLSVMDPFFVLPILMGISMYITQSLQPEPPDPVQARVFKLMPIMFTFFFLWFPSGLVLYWLVNNILSIMQQWYVTKQIEKGN